MKACPMLIARAHVCSSCSSCISLSSCSSPEGWRFVPDTILAGISGHPSGSRQGHPRYTGARSVGRPWVARTQFSTAVQCRNTANNFTNKYFLYFVFVFLFSFFHFLHVFDFSPNGSAGLGRLLHLANLSNLSIFSLLTTVFFFFSFFFHLFGEVLRHG